MSEPLGEANEPRNVIERAADAAMNAATNVIEEAGGEIKTIWIVIQAPGVDGPDGRDVVAAGTGFEGGSELFATLIAEAVSVGRQLGLTVLVAPLRRG
jgi:hypothetical protein